MWTYGFRVDPDNRQDRSNGPIIPRQMTPEEIEKYKNVGTYKKPSMVAVNELARKGTEMKAKINQERLLEICKENGFTFKAYNLAATEFGVEVSSVACYVSKNKLNKGKIEVKEENSVNETKVEEKSEISDVKVDSIVEDELEIISKIKSIVDENKAMTVENKTLKQRILKIKSALEDILKSIA